MLQVKSWIIMKTCGVVKIRDKDLLSEKGETQ
jgi:hypothetical protein